MSVSTVQLNFRVPEELYKKLEAKAAASEDSKTEIIRKALEEYLSKNA